MQVSPRHPGAGTEAIASACTATQQVHETRDAPTFGVDARPSTSGPGSFESTLLGSDGKLCVDPLVRGKLCRAARASGHIGSGAGAGPKGRWIRWKLCPWGHRGKTKRGRSTVQTSENAAWRRHTGLLSLCQHLEGQLLRLLRCTKESN